MQARSALATARARRRTARGMVANVRIAGLSRGAIGDAFDRLRQKAEVSLLPAM
ncbi:Hypothetical protein A7982_05218 [Minicystis rosea]|nr:Hypothetical protein A7982_05218 [Minicystis rosea]